MVVSCGDFSMVDILRNQTLQMTMGVLNTFAWPGKVAISVTVICDPSKAFSFPPSTMSKTKSVSTVKKDKGKQKEKVVTQTEVVQVVPETNEQDSEDSEEEEEDDEENGGVTEEGMQRLMQALGDEPLDEFDNAQLESLVGDDDDDSEEEAEGSDEEAVENSDAENDNEEVDSAGSEAGLDADETEEEDIALDDVESIDDDAVPKQKVEIDNEVRSCSHLHC